MYQSIKERVHVFFEAPKSFFGKAVHVFIILLIVASAGLMLVEYGYPEVFSKHEKYFNYADLVVLGVFTVEYVLRLWAAPKRFKHFFSFYSLIDLFAILPGYLRIGNAAGVRSLRLLRLVRFSRIFRVFRLFRYGKFFGTLFNLKNTILEKILPVILFFTVLKFCVFFLEIKGWWIQDYGLETVFSVVGFSLGIVLSQKIGVAYTKFILLEDAVTKLHGFILSLSSVFKEHYGDKKASKFLDRWVDTFHGILLRNKDRSEFYKINDELYSEIHKLVKDNSGYAELIRIYSRLNEEASFLLNRMDALTPKAYDQILHRSTIIYSFLLIVFLPGVSGIIATLVTTYVLYGMYQVTDDMDHAMTHLEDDLITADIEDLSLLRKNLT